MTDLAAALATAVADHGLEELIVRVSRYGDAGPEAFQAIAKYRGHMAGPWGVAVRADPGVALRDALLDGVRERPAPAGGAFD